MASDPDAAIARCPFLAQLNDMPRLTEARYADGLGELYQTSDPAEVAQTIFDQDGEMPNSAGLSALFTTWGQFLDHDLSLTPEGEHETMHDGLGHDVPRSEFTGGTEEEGARTFQNAISWQIDANNVYGSNEGRVADVRSFEGGKLLVTEDPTSDRGLLPRATAETVMAGETEGDDPVFLAGDVRANENPNLLSMHTLWMREHNHWAERLAEEHPDWTDQQLFDAARQIVEYEMQQITYTEWLPHLIGNVLPEDIAHDASLNGEVSLEFSTAAFRFGHTLVSSSLERVNEDGTVAEGGHLDLFEGFFDHTHVATGGIDGFLRGQTGQHAQELDTKVIDDLNFFLATPDGATGFSLVALNLMRSADHGIDSYVNVRAEMLGDIDPETLHPRDFSIITSDAQLQAELAGVYDTVFDVELWVGGLAEDAIPGQQMGPLFSHILAEQFHRTAAADETFGELDPAIGAEIIAEVQASGMREVILRNTDIDHIQDDPFVAAERSLTEVNEVIGTSADDTIELLLTSVGRGVHLLEGNDALALRGGTSVAEDIDAGAGDDTVDMSSGLVEGGILGMEGDDVLTLSNTAEAVRDISGGAGNDTLAIGDVAQVGQHVLTGDGDDLVDLNGIATVTGAIKTGNGDDTVTLEDGITVDRVELGHGADRVQIEAGANIGHIDGGHDPENRGMIDTLGISGDVRIEFSEGSTEDGTVFYLDETGAETGESFTFSEFEAIACFTRGTRIVTARGKEAIETLEPGDRVMTLDAGLCPVKWIGRRVVPARGRFAPILIRKGALGNSRDLLVSPQHRMLITSAEAELYFGAADVLVPAKALVNDHTIRPVEGGMVEYIHLMTERHQIVLAEGIPSESFHPGAVVLDADAFATREELYALFPELRPEMGGYGPLARPSVKVSEGRLLAPRTPHAARAKGCPFA